MRSIVASILGLLVCLFAASDLDRLRLPIICVFAYLGLDAVFYVVELARQKSGSPALTSANGADSERSAVLGFLSQLQQRARILDFAMEDIANYTDAQVGAAARVVHQGCRSFLGECFSLAPVETRAEGTSISIKKGFDPHQLRLIGATGERDEYSGRLVHKGWKTGRVSLPKLIQAPASGEVVIQPAEVEVKV